MKLIVANSAIRARTIWSALGDPDNVVVAHIGADFVDLQQKTPFDESNAFSPVWAVTDERAFRMLLKQCRDASEIVIGIEDDWLASVVEEALRCAGITAPIQRIVFDDLEPSAIKQAKPKPIDRDNVEVGWRVKIANRIISDALKPLRKLTDAEWQPTIDDILFLRRLVDANAADVDTGQVLFLDIDPKQPTDLGAIIRGSTQNSPTIVAEQIKDLLDHGLICRPTMSSTIRLREWCLETFGDSRIDLSDQKPQFVQSMLLPMNASVDLRSVIPAYRQTYTDIWQHAVHFFSLSLKVPAPTKQGPWRAVIGRTINSNPSRWIEAMSRLRAAGLVFGWSYVMPTDTGKVIDAMLRRSWSMLDVDFLTEVDRNLRDARFDRTNAIGAIKQATQIAREPSVPESATYCPACRGLLRVMMQQRRLRLVCQSAQCSRIWPAEQLRHVLVPLLAHDAPRWCQQCGAVKLHVIDVDQKLQATRQTCKECQASQTY